MVVSTITPDTLRTGNAMIKKIEKKSLATDSL